MRSFGKTSVVKRSFQAAWFDKFPWIHYDEALDAALCHLCARAENGGKLMANCKDVAFVSKGFTNWKDATEGFRRHEKSKCHAQEVLSQEVLSQVVKLVRLILVNPATNAISERSFSAMR